jgi:hypothetical protein
MHNKSKVFPCFVKFKCFVKNLLSCKMKSLHSDEGEKYFKSIHKGFLENHVLCNAFHVPIHLNKMALQRKNIATLLR